jgi:hypothetical protein
MSRRGPLAFAQQISELPTDGSERHERFVDFFGQFVFWLRNRSLEASRNVVESQEAREQLGTIRRSYYEGVAALPPNEREAALLLAQETLDGFLERLMWTLGDEGTDARFGDQCAYRFRITMEIVDRSTCEIIDEETINRGGKFFGSYWGRWLNRHKDK